MVHGVPYNRWFGIYSWTLLKASRVRFLLRRTKRKRVSYHKLKKWETSDDSLQTSNEIKFKIVYVKFKKARE